MHLSNEIQSTAMATGGSVSFVSGAGGSDALRPRARELADQIRAEIESRHRSAHVFTRVTDRRGTFVILVTSSDPEAANAIKELFRTQVERVNRGACR